MSTLVTIHTFVLPSEAHIVKGRLEAEGIRCFLQDELTVQVYHFYSHAIGGIKLQVPTEEAAEALAILQAMGYASPPTKSPFWENLQQRTDNWPFLSKLRVEWRFLLLLAIPLLVIAFFALIFFLPKKSDQLTQISWCLDAVRVNDSIYFPATIPQQFTLSGYCAELLSFQENGIVILPGFSSKMIGGKWEWIDDKILISQVDTLADWFDSPFTIDITKGQLTLTNNTTTFYCRVQ